MDTRPRSTSLQAPGDNDSLGNETFLAAVGRTIRVPQALDGIVQMLAPGEKGREGGDERCPF